ncbi:MAG: hypothetical protein EOP54_06785 [Sphingobacteriales bacterium]|nr:MAG: hypothetical protein EOP54_06785 [Sphingobacteriales bacterium]
MKTLTYLFSFLVSALCAGTVAYGTDSLKLLVDLPAAGDKHQLVQDFYYTLTEDKKVTVLIDWWHINKSGDRTKFIGAQSYEIKLPASANTFRLQYNKDCSQFAVHPIFAAAIRNTEGLLPVGSYYCNILIRTGSDTLSHQQFIKQVDPGIAAGAKFKGNILNLLQQSATGQQLLNEKSLSALNQSYKDKATNLLSRSGRKLDKYLGSRNLSYQESRSGNAAILKFYSDTLFMGSMELPAEQSFSINHKQEKQKLRAFASDLTNTGLETMESLHSQFRKIGERQEEEKELIGNLFLGANTGNGQERNSMQDNNYYELGGDINLPVMGIPVQLTGFYTSQDRGRQAKASNFKISYDAAKAKEQLTELVTAFSGQYENVKSRGTSYGMVYQQYIQSLKSEQGNVLQQMKGQVSGLGNTDITALSEAKLKQLLAEQIQDIEVKARSKADSSGDIAGAKAYADSLKTQATAKYEQAMQQYEKLKSYQEKIEHYSTLLEQYAKMVHYDSLMAYSKVKDLKDIESMSTKDMARKAGAILPEGKAKSFLTGLTNLDVGMLTHYVSDYTQSGQMMKGIDLGYDLGVAAIGASYGNTEYIGRSGDIEKYKVLGLRSMFKPVAKQHLGLIYYNYSPARNLFKDTAFFRPEFFSVSNFDQPTHILSLTYNGEIGKSIRTVGEYAFSNQQYEQEERPSGQGMLQRSAYNFGIEAAVPKTNVNINAAYEYVGKAFENNTMPVLMAGTQRAKIGGDGIFFNSFLKLAVEYSYLLQSNFTNTGRNNKWGFTVATQSKRYPSVSLSYKPFATFRTFEDTLQIQQKPVVGEVWTGKLNYQIKRKHYSLRFALVGNKNNSILDTLKYGSTMVQFNTIYTTAKTNLSANIAYSSINTGIQDAILPAFNNSINIGLAGGRNLKMVSLNGTVDMGFNESGICKYGAGLNALYRLPQVPVSIRVNCRLMQFKLNPADPWTNLIFAGLTLNWQLKMKLSN